MGNLSLPWELVINGVLVWIAFLKLPPKPSAHASLYLGPQNLREPVLYSGLSADACILILTREANSTLPAPKPAPPPKKKKNETLG